MAQQGKPVVSTGPRMLKRIAPWFLRKTAANMPKLSNVLEEFIRNARFHGHAENINISIVRGANGAPELHITDDGDGMLQRGRLHFAYCLGNPHGDRDDTQREKYGTGSGARFSAYGLCQVIEAITVPRDAPSGAAWRTVVHLPQFIEDAGGEISEDTDWDRTRRSDTPFDPKLTHGTMFILRDFRASDPRAPFDESRMRDTSRRVTEDEVRQIVEGFVPDIAKRVAVGGRRINPPKPAGYPLWAQNPREERGLGTVSGDIRYVEDARARWCTIGGTTATVSLRTFMDDCHEHRPDLSALLPRELFDARLSGYIRIAVLEDFPTQSREHLDPSFWATEAAAGSIMFLVQVVGPTLQARLAEYAARPASEETRASLERILARLHEAQGITPGHVAGGGGTDESAGPRPEDQPLQVNRVTIRIEVAQPDGVVERGTFRITNALDGETFTWTDGGKRLIESKGDHGESATVHAVRRAGVYPVDVQSDQYPNRKRTLNVDVYTPEEPVRGSEFRLIPERTVMSVGDEKEISIRSEGPTSGPYRWSAVRVRGGQRRAVDAFLEVRTGARQVVFRRPSEPGDYVVTVTCTKTNLTATCEAEVHAQPPADPPGPIVCGGGGPGGGDGFGGPGSRPSAVGRELDFHFGPYHLKVRGAPFLAQPWSLEVENRMVGISDSHPANSGARSADERDRHVAWCLASCLVAYRVAKRDLDGSDAMEVSQVHDAVLRYVFGSPDAPQAAPSPLTTSAAPAKSAGRRLTGPRPAVR